MQLTQDVLETMLQEAAERGAKKALESIGLADEDAGKDVRELRLLITSWRIAKKAVLSSLLQWITVAILGALSLGLYSRWHNH